MNIVIKNLSKSYGKKVVLNDFSYEFKPGLYILKGDNGTGKSTLIKIMAGLVYPTKMVEMIVPKNLSYLPEYIELSEGRSKSFLKAVKKIYKAKNSNINELMNEWNLENKKMKSLSQGNRKKVLLICSFMKNSQLYLYDEPLNGLDSDTVTLFVSKIEKLIDLDKTIIISTHEDKYFEALNPEVIYFESC